MSRPRDIVVARRVEGHGDDPDLSREAERHARRSAVALVRLHGRGGTSLRATARALCVARSTLWDWTRRWSADRLAARVRGRPPRRLTRGAREVVLFALRALGRRASLCWLKWLVPEASRSAIRGLRDRARRAWQRRRRRSGAQLTWRRVGAVWAWDFTDAPRRVEGASRSILVVRDLASGHVLASEPVEAADAASAVRVLARVFASHGAPLVLKSDNGGALVSWDVQLLLAVHGVLLLRSPVRLPSYNGACEAGVGSLKALVDHVAQSHGRWDRWTRDDVEAARCLGNATACAPCDPSRTPDDVWDERQPIAQCERSAFHALYRRHAADERARRGHPSDAALGLNEQASIDRRALRRALVEAGDLEIRWRSIPSLI